MRIRFRSNDGFEPARMSGPSRPALRTPFATVVLIRLGVWLVAAVGLLWAPLAPQLVSPFRAYTGIGDWFFGTFAQWDSGWFARIALHGYDVSQTAAFFPLYPLCLAALRHLTGSTIVAGSLLSLAAGATGAVLVRRIALELLTPRLADDSLLYVALYPIAFVFTALYSDALFLALAAGAMLAGLRRRSLAAGVLCALAIATRIVGLALLPALAVLLWPRRRRLRDAAGLVPLALSPLVLLAFALYLRSRFGDPWSFTHAEGVFWLRHTGPLGPLSGLWDSTTAAWHGSLELLRHLPRSGRGAPYPPAVQWAIWNVVQFVLLLAAIWLTVVAWRRLGPALGLYSAATIAIVLTSPAAVVPLVSFPRYLLGDFPVFIALATVTEQRPRLRAGLLGAFAAVGAVAAVLFSRHVWIA